MQQRKWTFIFVFVMIVWSRLGESTPTVAPTGRLISWVGLCCCCNNEAFLIPSGMIIALNARLISLLLVIFFSFLWSFYIFLYPFSYCCFCPFLSIPFPLAVCPALVRFDPSSSANLSPRFPMSQDWWKSLGTGATHTETHVPSRP